MTKKEEKKVFAPQVEIDGEKYHESAEVVFGITKEDSVLDPVTGAILKPRIYRLKRFVLVRDRPYGEKVLRVGEGSIGRVEVENQLHIEVKKELKRLEGDK